MTPQRCSRIWFTAFCRAGGVMLAGILLAHLAGCSCRSEGEANVAASNGDGDKPAPTTQPTTDDGEESKADEPVATAPAETQPAEPELESEYTSEPPYTVKLYVRDPEEKQPGWLRITEMMDGDSLAKTTGTFPERNRIYIDTDNVQRIRIHIDQLPISPNKRIILRIDDQPMELARRDRLYVYLEKQTNGAWASVEPPGE